MNAKTTAERKMDARSEFCDEVAELIANARQAGVRMGQIQADFDAVMSVQVPDEVCPGCGLDADHDEDECPGDAVRRAIALALDDEYWSDSDTRGIVLNPDHSWTSPQTFGTIDGKWAPVVATGVDGTYYQITIYGEDDQPTTAIVRV